MRDFPGPIKGLWLCGSHDSFAKIIAESQRSCLWQSGLRINHPRPAQALLKGPHTNSWSWKPNLKSKINKLCRLSGIYSTSIYPFLCQFLAYVNKIGSLLMCGEIVQCTDDSTICFSSNSTENLDVQTFIYIYISVTAFKRMKLKTN